MNDQLYLMGENYIVEHIRLMKNAEKMMFKGDSGKTETQNAVIRHEDFNELKISGTMIANENWITQWLGINTTAQYMKAFDELLDEDKQILLNIDSPGGEAKLAFEFADMIYAAGDQVIGFTNGIAASGGMLVLQACQGGRYVHDSAIIGSVGVLGYIASNKNDNMKIVSSRNAKNKLPSIKPVQKRVDQIESLFIERLSIYTGMSGTDIVERGDSGAVFTGDYALANNFVDEISTYKGITEKLMSKETDKKAEDKIEDVNASEISANRDARWSAIMAHPAAQGKSDVIIHYVNLDLSIEDCIKSLDLMNKEPAAPAAPTPAPEKIEDKPLTGDEIQERIDAGIESGVADAIKKARISDNTDVGGGSDADDKDKVLTDEERGEIATDRQD